MIQQDMLYPKERIMIALSGGADSVCLFRLLISLKEKYKLELMALHVEHGLRGQASLDDATFVKELCNDYNIPLQQLSCNVVERAKITGRTIEEEARMVRYEFFAKMAKEWKADAVAIAHNATDNVETILFHLARGTGLLGLTGIRPIRDCYIRPLLCVTSEEIRFYMKEIGQAYQEDKTNQDVAYARNRIRHCILPQMKQVNPAAERHIIELKDEMMEIKEFITQAQDLAIMHYTEIRDGVFYILQECFIKEKKYIQNCVIHEILSQCAQTAKDIERIHVESVRELIDSQVGKKIDLPYDMTAYRSYRGIEIFKKAMAKNEEKDYSGSVVLEIVGTTNLPFWSATVATRVFDYKGDPMEIPKNRYTKWFDYDIIKKRLVARKRQPGDYIVINQEGGRKSVKKLFTDEKIPEKDRDKQMLIMIEDECLWVVGVRIGESAKVGETTKEILEIKIDGGFCNE